MMREGDGYNQLQIERAREDKLGNLSVCSCVQLRAPPRGSCLPCHDKSLSLARPDLSIHHPQPSVAVTSVTQSCHINI